MRLYFDTSALVPLYVGEATSSQAVRRLQDAEAIYVSWLTGVELRSALALKTRTRAVNLESAARVLGAFQRHLERKAYEVLPVDQEVFTQASKWLERFETPLRALDALHLACCHRADLTLVTVDGGLARSAEHFGVPCDFIGES